ncbi:hypothetical protein OFO99_27530, partial [Escherichia coli]|nr:hypothetical protein [Escherichia coli]
AVSAPVPTNGTLSKLIKRSSIKMLAYCDLNLICGFLCDRFNHYRIKFDVIGYENGSVYSRDGHSKHA